MENTHEKKVEMRLSSDDFRSGSLASDCENCFGFCCAALYFSKADGFPINKEAGKPCPNLQEDFRCSVHESLWEKGFKGCTSFDCFGSGQKVAKATYGGRDWRKNPETSKQMFEVFQVMRQIHEMLWYLEEALDLKAAEVIHGELGSMLYRTEELTHLSPEDILRLDLAAHRSEVNSLLLKTSELVRSEVRQGKKSSLRQKKVFGRGLDFIGADLRRADLRGENLRSACLIAANLRGTDLTGADLIGADLRDADLSGACLENSIFLTQAQVNTAKGDSRTRLPGALIRPQHWLK